MKVLSVYRRMKNDERQSGVLEKEALGQNAGLVPKQYTEKGMSRTTGRAKRQKRRRLEFGFDVVKCRARVVTLARCQRLGRNRFPATPGLQSRKTI